MNKSVVTTDFSVPDLNMAAVESLSVHLDELNSRPLSASTVLIRSATNEEKYSNSKLPYGSDADLVEVFELMRSLNYQGITDSSVGRSGGEGLCLADVLNKTCDAIASRFESATIDYVELGPEPVKTELLLSALLARGVDIASYTSIDINPSSAKPMREAVTRVSPKIDIHHLSANFNHINADILGKQNPVLFTSLGFQEGNHPPSQTYNLLQRIMRSGDLFLTEMQLYSPANTAPIERFYQLDQMKRFSKNCLRRAYGNMQSSYNTSLANVDIDEARYKVAICHEEFLDDGGRTVYFVTNYCLKYTLDELRMLREARGEFAVISEITTGDGSLVLQLCECLPDLEPK